MDEHKLYEVPLKKQLLMFLLVLLLVSVAVAANTWFYFNHSMTYFRNTLIETNSTLCSSVAGFIDGNLYQTIFNYKYPASTQDYQKMLEDFNYIQKGSSKISYIQTIHFPRRTKDYMQYGFEGRTNNQDSIKVSSEYFGFTIYKDGNKIRVNDYRGEYSTSYTFYDGEKARKISWDVDKFGDTVFTMENETLFYIEQSDGIGIQGVLGNDVTEDEYGRGIFKSDDFEMSLVIKPVYEGRSEIEPNQIYIDTKEVYAWIYESLSSDSLGVEYRRIETIHGEMYSFIDYILDRQGQKVGILKVDVSFSELQKFQSNLLVTLLPSALISIVVLTSIIMYLYNKIIVGSMQHTFEDILTALSSERNGDRRQSKTGFITFDKFNETISSYVQELKDDTYNDQLTKCYNRRFLDEVLVPELENMLILDSKAPYLIIALDLDKFKNVNDNYGHDVGDLMLIKFATILKDFLRNHDCVVRSGGEEFLVIVKQINIEHSYKFMERLRKQIENNLIVKTLDGEKVKTTASMGGISVPMLQSEALKVQDYLKFADLCLYFSKRSGRNCYTLLEPIKPVKVGYNSKILTSIEFGEQSGYWTIYNSKNK